MMPIRYHDKSSLIREIKKRPILWDVDHPKYSDRFLSAVGWANVAQKLQLPEKTVKSKWKNLRDIFIREYKKFSCSSNKYRGKWKYFQEMTFLKENYVMNEDENDKGEKEDEYPIEFIVVNYSEGSDELLTDDDRDDVSYDNNSKFTTELKVNKSAYKIKAEENDLNSDDETFLENEYENLADDISEASLPRERKADINNDIMFLKSLALYFNELKPDRKLVMRNRIQELLLKELTEQGECK